MKSKSRPLVKRTYLPSLELLSSSFLIYFLSYIPKSQTLSFRTSKTSTISKYRALFVYRIPPTGARRPRRSPVMGRSSSLGAMRTTRRVIRSIGNEVGTVSGSEGRDQGVRVPEALQRTEGRRLDCLGADCDDGEDAGSGGGGTLWRRGRCGRNGSSCAKDGTESLPHVPSGGGVTPTGELNTVPRTEPPQHYHSP